MVRLKGFYKAFCLKRSSNILSCLFLVSLFSINASAQDSLLSLDTVDSNHSLENYSIYQERVPIGSTVVDATEVFRNGQKYSLLKYRYFDTDISGEIIIDSTGKNDLDRLPDYSVPVIDPNLRKAIITASARDRFDVSILLKLPPNLEQWDDTRSALVTSSIADDDGIRYFANAKQMSEGTVLKNVKDLQSKIERHENRVIE